MLLRERNAWIDSEILPSTDWMREVRTAIDAASAVIFLISPDSVASTVCREELAHAVSQSKRLIPIDYRPVDPARIDESLRKLNWVSIRDTDNFDQKVEQLMDVLDYDLAWRDFHTRLLVRAGDWEAKGRERSLLLHGNDLKDAEKWVVTIGSDRTPRPTPLQSQYVIESRRAETTRQRYLLAGVGAALVVTATLAVYAFNQSRIAAHQRDVALSRLLASRSLESSSDGGRLDLALLLGAVANQIQPTLEAQNSLFSALDSANRILKFVTTPSTRVSLALSPDGATLATGTSKGGIVLWDAATLTEKRTMQQGQGAVESLSFSPDGTTLASAGSGRIVLWDTGSGQERRVLEGGHPSVRRVVWHPEGSHLYSSSRNEPLIFVWDLATGTRSEIPDTRLMTIDVSPDGKTIASAEEYTGAVRLWDTATRKVRAVLKGGSGTVRAIAFSPDGSLVAGATQGSTIIIWDAVTGAERKKLEGQHDRLECLAFSPDGKRLASGSNNRTIVLWDVTTGKPLEQLDGHKNSLVNLVFTRDGQRLISIAFDSTLMVWNVAMPHHRARLLGHQADVRTLAVSPDGSTIASGSDDGTIRLWDAATGSERAVLSDHRGPVRTVAFSPDSAALASGSDDDKRILIWEVASGHRLRELDASGEVTSVIFTPDGRALASGAESRSSILIQDAATGAVHAELQGHESEVDALAFSRDGKVLVSGGDEGSVRVWNVSTWKEIVAAVGAGGAVAQIALSPDGQSAVSSADMSLLMFGLYDDKEPIQLDTLEASGSASIAYSPDGSTLAYTSGELQFNIVLWDIRNRRPRGILEGSATTMSMVFLPDGKRLVTGHSNGEVILWNVEIESWPRRACEIANRNLTQEEWRSFVSEDLPFRAVCPGLPLE